jgi:hypothetical protein
METLSRFFVDLSTCKFDICHNNEQRFCRLCPHKGKEDSSQITGPIMKQNGTIGIKLFIG